MSVIIEGANDQEIMLAFLGEEGFESFQQDDNKLLAFIPADSISENQINDFFNKLSLRAEDYKIDYISETNWNKLWEKNYEEVIIDGKCMVRAPFHKEDQNYDYTITIEPQMSFGTAHHDTTYLMIKEMLGMEMKSKAVLDMGSGTGILAIFASVKGASEITAIDNNIWAFQNSRHNLKLNRIDNVKLIEGDASGIPEKKYDVILANINRNVLLQDIPVYVKYMNTNADLLISGFLKNDLHYISALCEKRNLKKYRINEKNEWVVMQLKKII